MGEVVCTLRLEGRIGGMAGAGSSILGRDVEIRGRVIGFRIFEKVSEDV